MVGDARGQRGDAARLTADLRAAYDTAAGEWAGGPEQMYARLAGALVAASPVPLAGRSVLDLGAGTGVAGRAALAAGAWPVVAADLAIGMLCRAGPALHPVAADAATLPFRDASFDLVLAALSLSHLVDLAAGLREARRVGRAIAASTFAPGWSHPARAAVDEALRPFGYRPPAWYVRLKRETEPRAEDPDQLAGLAAAAGFRRVRLRTAAVPTGLATPAELASWRLGMANIAPFVSSLGPARQAELRHAAEGAVAGMAPLVVSVMVLTAS
jgi:ubiquinone/menaquinone biosynthesis C-methylase UbiE